MCICMYVCYWVVVVVVVVVGVVFVVVMVGFVVEMRDGEWWVVVVMVCFSPSPSQVMFDFAS